MVTPRKSEILERATQLFMEQEFRRGSRTAITPTYGELLESGFVSQAQSELMSNPESLYGLVQQKSSKSSRKMSEKIQDSGFVVDVEELLKSGVYICGTSGSGKSDLAMYVADRLMAKNVTVYIVDPSQDWQRRSNVPYVVTVPENLKVDVLDASTVFDTSMLSVSEQRKFIESLTDVVFRFQVTQSEALRKWRVLIYEEAQIVFPEGSFRSDRKSSSLRLVSVGRNFKVRFVAITPFSANVDKMLTKMTSQRWFGSSSELNDLNYLRGFLGDRVEELKGLKAGEFIYHFPQQNVLHKIRIEPHKRNRNVMRIEGETHRETKSVETGISSLSVLLSVIAFLCFVGAWLL